MIIKFKKNYYYKFIGSENNYYWFKDNEKILNRKWHKCVKTQKIACYAQFEGMEDGWYWVYKNFIECKYHPYVKRLLEEI
jgi:hypothetical protein